MEFIVDFEKNTNTFSSKINESVYIEKGKPMLEKKGIEDLCELIIGGNDSKSSLESRITGNLSMPSIRCAYSIPLGLESKISAILNSSVSDRGTKVYEAGTVSTRNGGLREARS